LELLLHVLLLLRLHKNDSITLAAGDSGAHESASDNDSSPLASGIARTTATTPFRGSAVYACFAEGSFGQSRDIKGRNMRAKVFQEEENDVKYMLFLFEHALFFGMIYTNLYIYYL
jgi:hypothetical protein